jgi:hypothetical protein
VLVCTDHKLAKTDMALPRKPIRDWIVGTLGLLFLTFVGARSCFEIYRAMATDSILGLPRWGLGRGREFSLVNVKSNPEEFWWSFMLHLFFATIFVIAVAGLAYLGVAKMRRALGMPPMHDGGLNIRPTHPIDTAHRRNRHNRDLP